MQLVHKTGTYKELFTDIMQLVHDAGTYIQLFSDTIETGISNMWSYSVH